MVQGDYGNALAYLSDQLNPQKAKQPAEQPKRTFGSYLDTEWKQYMADKWKPSTQITQGSYVQHHIRPYFSDMLLSEIKPSTIVAFYVELEAKNLSRKTRRNLHAILTGIFNYAVELELITRNPVKKGIAPKKETTEKVALSAQQLYQVFNAVPIRYKAFFMVLGLTGVRCEALGLQWRDIDFVARQLHIRRAIYRQKETTPKTTSSIRPRPIMPELRDALLNHKVLSAYTKPTDYVFACRTGRPLNPDTLREVLHAALKQIGVQFDQPHADGMHLLRQSSGSLVYCASGGDLKATQEWLGHSSSRITADVYIHLAKNQQQQTAQGLQQAIFAQPVPVSPGHTKNLGVHQLVHRVSLVGGMECDKLLELIAIADRPVAQSG
jgi:integrase